MTFPEKINKVMVGAKSGYWSNKPRAIGQLDTFPPDFENGLLSHFI